MKFYYKYLLVSMAIFAFVAQARAQELRVTGTVRDSTRAPLPGVNILIKGKSQGTTTNFDGEFKLRATPTDTLVVSYLGYQRKQIPVEDQTTFEIVLWSEANALQQVVINAGYYNTTQRERTGSISRITAEEIEKQPVNNPLAAMQGRMPGVHIVQTSGVPGGGFEVRIRGQNSIMAGNEPLYIVDGVPYGSTSLGSFNTSGPILPSAKINPLNAINPAAIESIEVLKDADATAIYGSRGANGVILITTKKGKEGKTKFTISNSTGIAHIARRRDLLNTEEYLEMRKEAFANDGITEYPATAYDINGTWDMERYTDWQDALIGGTAKTQKIQGTVSGGSEQTQFLLSGMYQNETTVFPGNFKYDRLTVNSNINHTDKTERFQISFIAGYTIQNNLLPAKDLTFDALHLPPNAPSLYGEEGGLNWENGTWTNPLAQLKGRYQQNNKTLFSNSVISYKIFDKLQIKLNAGYGHTQLQDNKTTPHTVYNPAYGMDSGVSMIFTNEGSKQYWIAEPQLQWKKKWNMGKLSVLVGSTFQEHTTEQYGLMGMGFANDRFLYNLGAASSLTVIDEHKTTYKYHSIFGRVNYTYQNKLFFNLTGRRDGSSRFGPGNKYGNFGAIGAAWLFSEEVELPWLSFGKLRGSYGVTGNDQIGDYQYLQTYTISNYPYGNNIGLQPARLNNPNFKWEKNVKKEVALELGFLQQRILLSTAYYHNRSSNQLIGYALPGTTGFASIQANLKAVVGNSGWELELSAAPFRNENFNWDISFNLSLPKNKLLGFPGLENSTYADQLVIDEPLSIAKLYKLKGVNEETGLFEFEDYNEDGKITGLEDQQYIADLTPSLFGGFSNVLKYKNWSMNIFFQFVKKKGYNQYRYSQSPGTMLNQPVDVLDRWQVLGDQATVQRFTTGGNYNAYLAYSQFTQSSGMVSDASFIRLKSLALSYMIPVGKDSNTFCKIFLQGQNLLTFTRFKGGDPEQITGFLPPLRKITMGVQLQL